MVKTNISLEPQGGESSGTICETLAKIEPVPQSFASVNLHIVFSTKGRVPSLKEDCRAAAFEYLGGICRNLDCPPILIGGTADHVHLLVRLSRSISIKDLLSKVKSNSSSWMKQHVPTFSWQSGYAAFALGDEALPALVRYVGSQEEHHSTVSFQDELRELLREHGFEWKEEFIWE